MRQVAGGASPTILWDASKDTPLVNDVVVEEETAVAEAPTETPSERQLIKVVQLVHLDQAAVHHQDYFLIQQVQELSIQDMII